MYNLDSSLPESEERRNDNNWKKISASKPYLSSAAKIGSKLVDGQRLGHDGLLASKFPVHITSI